MDFITSTDAHDSYMSTGFFSFSKPEKQGWLTKQGGRVKNWKRRWFVLKDNRMYYYKSPKDGNPLGFIPLERCAMRIVENSNKKFCFEIFDPHQPFSRYHPSFFIYADTQEEMTDWINRLNLRGEVEVHSDNEPVDPVEKEGWLMKQGGIVKNWKKRWFKLQGNYLYYYKQKTDKEPLGFIPIDRASINVLDPKQTKKKHAFEIRDPSNSFNKWHKSYFVCAETEDDMKEWINKIVNVTFTYTPDTMTPDRSRTHTLESVVSYFTSNPNNNNTSTAPRVQKTESSVTLAEMMAIPQSLVSIVAYLDVNQLNAFDLMKYSETKESQEEIKAILETITNNLPLDMEILEECSNYVEVAIMLFDYLPKHFKESPIIPEQTAELLRKDFESSKGEQQIKAMKATLSQHMSSVNQTRLKYFIAFLGRIKDRNELSKFDNSSVITGQGSSLVRTSSEEKNSRTFQQTSTLFLKFLFPYLYGSNNRPLDDSKVSLFQDILRTMLKNYDTLLLGSLENN